VGCMARGERGVKLGALLTRYRSERTEGAEKIGITVKNIVTAQNGGQRSAVTMKNIVTAQNWAQRSSVTMKNIVTAAICGSIGRYTAL